MARSCIVAVLTFAVGLTAVSVEAAPARHGAGYAPPAADEPDPPEGFQPRLSAESGVLCVKQCPNDNLPCDPPSYKVADGRCTTQWR